MLNRVIEGDFPCKQFVLELEDAEGEERVRKKGNPGGNERAAEGGHRPKSFSRFCQPFSAGAGHQGNGDSRVSLAVILVIK